MLMLDKQSIDRFAVVGSMTSPVVVDALWLWTVCMMLDHSCVNVYA